MSAPSIDFAQAEFNNPGASMPLLVPIAILMNTPDAVIEANVRANSAQYPNWLKSTPAHDGVAIMVAGGPSADDYLHHMLRLQAAGGTVFAMNGASRWARSKGVAVDHQIIVDAKPETATLVDAGARGHLFAAQCDPATFALAPSPVLWHRDVQCTEEVMPAERKRRGGYVLIGGGSSAGVCALCVAFAMGYRTFHLFGYDSSHREGASHAYKQDINNLIPVIPVQWGERTFKASVAMKAQAEKFQIIGQALEQDGCTLELYGDGLLQTMWKTAPSDVPERNKYQLMWQYDEYRKHSPGELAAETAMDLLQPDSMVIDFGCGTGRAGIAMRRLGLDVLLIDFADNCRDDEALGLPFLQWDLTQPIPARANWGFCCDVLEHIPTHLVEQTVRNIMDAARTVFIQIGTEDAHFGGEYELHLTQRPHDWWREVFLRLGYLIEWEQRDPIAALFIITRGRDASRLS